MTTKPTLNGVPNLPPIAIHSYERYLPTAFDESMSILQKMNKVINHLNDIGEITNNVVGQWNALMKWLLDNGLTDIISDEIDKRIADGTFNELITNIVGDLTLLETIDKTNMVQAINEVNKIAVDNEKEIGDISLLNTINKNSIVESINEMLVQVNINKNAPISIGESTGHGVISGLKVRQQNVLAMAVEIGNSNEPNIVHMPNGVRYTPTSIALAVIPSHPTLDRIDIVYVSEQGVISYLDGVPAISPVPPLLPIGGEMLAEISVKVTDTTVNDIDITDKRALKSLSVLLTNNKSNLVQAINEIIASLNDVINNAVGDVANLPTTDKTTIVNAIIEIVSEMGNISDLITVDKTSIVNAINEVVKNIGLLGDLDTTDKTSIVNAINEVISSLEDVINDAVGDVDNLPTADKTNIVNAIIEVVNNLNDVINNIGLLANLDTTDKTSIVNAINEIISEIGELTELNTTDKTSIVNAINEVNTRIDTEITTQLSSVIIQRNVLKYGVTGDGVTDDTIALNNLAEGYHWIFPSGTYMIKAHTDDGLSHGGFRPKSNTKYTFLEGARLKAITTSHSIYSIVWIDTQNVLIENMEVVGERSTHIGTTGEQAYGINIRNYATVKLVNPTAYDCWGDGFIINTFIGSRVEIVGANSYNNRRQGISIMCCDVVRVYSSIFRDSNGTAPQMGLDIEPNYPTDILNDILFYDCTFSDNKTAGIGIYGGSFFPDHYKIDFVNCISKGNVGVAVVIQTLTNSDNGLIRFTNLTCENDGVSFRDSFANVFIDGLFVKNGKRGIRIETGINNSISGNVIARNVILKDTVNAMVKAIELFNIGGFTGNKIRDVDIEIVKHNLTPAKMVLNNGGAFEGKRRIITNSVYDSAGNIFSSAIGAYAHQTITNKGATASISIELNNSSTKTVGTEFEFIVESAFAVNITTVDSTIIPLGFVRITSSQIGSKIKLRYDGTNWRVIEQVGTWASY